MFRNLPSSWKSVIPSQIRPSLHDSLSLSHNSFSTSLLKKWIENCPQESRTHVIMYKPFWKRQMAIERWTELQGSRITSWSAESIGICCVLPFAKRSSFGLSLFQSITIFRQSPELTWITPRNFCVFKYAAFLAEDVVIHFSIREHPIPDIDIRNLSFERVGCIIFCSKMKVVQKISESNNVRKLREKSLFPFTLTKVSLLRCHFSRPMCPCNSRHKIPKDHFRKNILWWFDLLPLGTSRKFLILHLCKR